MNKQRRIMTLLAVAILLAAGGGFAAMVLSREQPETRIPDVPLPLVRSHVVRLQDLTLTVASQGTVMPRTQSSLVPEVAGRVIEVSPSFNAGGFFEAGDLLLKIESNDYEQSLIQARAAVRQAELRLEQQRAEAEVARQEWNDLGSGDGSPLTLRVPQLAEAEAALQAAIAARARAERDLERTEIRAPYSGRLLDKQVDVGQFVSRGTPVARIYAVDFAEVRLPLPDDQLAFVDLPLAYRGSDQETTGPTVTLRADFAGKSYDWVGKIVRTEGEIDPKTRMVHAVARIRDPYGQGSDPNRPPLAVGLFVEAEIEGRLVRDVVEIPRAALREGGRVLVIDAEDRLRFREVEILRSTGARLIVSAGLAEGERVNLSPLAAVTDGMQVRVEENDRG